MSKIVPAKSICADCARATALEGRLGCDWIRKLKPVYGMRYRKRIAYSGNTKSKTICLRVVVDCPDYIAASVADEYRFALRSGNEGRIKQLEREMKSDHFYMLSGLDGDELIRLMREKLGGR